MMKIITRETLIFICFISVSFFNCNNGNLQHISTAEQTSNPSTDDYVKSGTKKTLLNDYRGAVNDFDKAIELSPNNSTAFALRGNAKIYLNDFAGAFTRL